MNQAIRNLLSRLEASGKQHDSDEPDHSKRYLNLEPDTAEAVVLLLRIAGVRHVLEVGTSNGYSTIWISSALSESKGRVTSIERNPQKHQQARDNLVSVGL